MYQPRNRVIALVLLLILAQGLVWSPEVWAACATNATSTNESNALAASSPQTHTTLTVAAGSNLALVCAIYTSIQAPAFTSITWGAQSMALITNAVIDRTLATGHIELWGLVAPNTGNQTVTATWTGGTTDIQMECRAYSGVHQGGTTSTFAHVATNRATSTNATVTVTSAANNCSFEAGVGAQAYGAVAGEGTSINVENNMGCCYTEATGMISDGGDASVMFTRTTASGAWAAVAVDVAEVSASAPSSNLLLLGVGPTHD